MVVAIVAVARVSIVHAWVLAKFIDWLVWLGNEQVACVGLNHESIGEVVVEEVGQENFAIPSVYSQNLSV